LFFSTIGLLAFAFGVFKLSYKWKNHQKYIENRVLAEALRIQFFWNISAIDHSVSEYVIRIHKKEYNWLRHILQSIYGLTKLPINANRLPINDIVKFWIESQQSYFSRKVQEIEKKERNHKIISRVTFGLGLIILIGIFALNYFDHHHKWLHPLIVVDSVMFGCFALVKAYHEKKGYEQTINQYSLMFDIYSAANKKIKEISPRDSKDTSEEIERILFLTGKEAIIENGNWYMVYKDKEPEIEGIG
jgi:hypothetical protein